VNTPKLTQQSISDVGAEIRAGKTTASEVVRAALSAVDALDKSLRAFVTVDRDGALASAAKADEELIAGLDRGPLHGIPIAVKDNLPTAGLRTTYNSRAYASWVPRDDCAPVARLRAAGAVIIGKTNLNQFGWSVPSDDDLMAPPRNPWNQAYAAVGSSSGSGAAVSAGMVMAALGTDGGGSIRLPASQMGLVGLKPSRGSVPGHGSVHDEISVVGVVARTAVDAAVVYNAIANKPCAGLAGGLAGIKVAVPVRQVVEAGSEPDVTASFNADLQVLNDLGANIVEIDLPYLGVARDATIIMICALQHALHARDVRQRPEALGRSALLYQMQGAALSAADYINAQRMGLLFAAELDTTMGDCALVATPVSPVVTAEAARRPGEHGKGKNAIFTAPFNLIGWPAISVPSSVGELGLPIGLHLGARPGGECLLLSAAEVYGAQTGQTSLRPPVPSARA